MIEDRSLARQGVTDAHRFHGGRYPPLHLTLIAIMKTAATCPVSMLGAEVLKVNQMHYAFLVALSALRRSKLADLIHFRPACREAFSSHRMKKHATSQIERFRAS